jgi:CRP-like cAMP-binding protein
MAAKLLRFRTKRDLITRDTAAQLAAQIRLFPEEQLPAQARAAMLNQLQRFTHPDSDQPIWAGGFSMLSRVQTAAVWNAIRALPADARPNHVRHAFDLVLLNLRQDTGEVMLTRDQLADEIGTKPENVSRIMGTLERMGVIRRERRRVEGIRGRGMAVYFINPHVAWNGSLEIRKEEAAAASPPLLTLMQGGASE